MFAEAVRERERLLQPDPRGNRFVDQGVERRRADRLQHRRRFVRVGTDMPGLERLEIEDGHFTRS